MSSFARRIEKRIWNRRANPPMVPAVAYAGGPILTRADPLDATVRIPVYVRPLYLGQETRIVQ